MVFYTKLILICLCFSCFICQETLDDFIVSQLICGKKNPKSAKDCTKYGTDSKFLCCAILPIGSSKVEGNCFLLSYSAANELGIKGESIISYQGANKTVSCGNNAFYPNLKNAILSSILVIIALL